MKIVPNIRGGDWFMLLGKQLGPFKVEKELGSGAMGAVYQGIDEKGRKVAIKIIAPGLATNKTAVERFLRESAVLKKVAHPNIARYLGSGRYHGTPFYVMEYLQGESLDHILNRRVKLSWDEVVTIGTQLCAALQVAHDAGIIHRDLKPSNLMILPDGKVKLTDFGIAKDTDAYALTATHSTLGTAAYMSPEQCRGAKDITFKSDLYSMGVMFYELVTGKKPFTADNPMDVFLMHVKAKFARPSTFAMDLPIWLDNLICNLMEKNPDDRPLNAARVGEELASIANKVAEQRSAGIDRAAKRRADRTTHDMKLDDTDKEVARELLGKKKKKRALPAFYSRNSFTLAALGGIGLASLLFIYFVFLKAPSAESLYQQAAGPMKSEKLEVRKEAREPIDAFLRYHPNHEKAADVKAWRDQLEIDITRFFVEKDRPVDRDPPDAWKAIGFEKEGRLDDAIKHWKNVVALKSSDDSELRGWGLLAERSLADLTQAMAFDKDVNDRVFMEANFNQPAKAKGELDKYALDAARSADDRKKSVRAWDDLKRLTDSPGQRPYYLLAVKRLRELQ